MTNWLGLDARPAMTREQADTYDQMRTPARSRVLLHTVATICAFYLSYALVDILLLRDVIWISLVLRFGLILPIALLLMAYLRSSASIAAKEVAALGVSVSGNLVWCIILVASDNPAAQHYYYAAVIFQMVITIAAKSPFFPSLVASVVTFALNYAFIWFIEGSTPIYVLHHFAVYFPAAVLTLVACHQLEAERLLVFLQAYENEGLKNELSRQNDELVRLSHTDPLTQLPNRRATAAAVARMRQGLDAQLLSSCALLVIDIDHFKAFNDNYGHGTGDECLVEVARAMREVLSSEQMHIGRHGGEEFIAILPGYDSDRAGQLAERLRAVVAALAITHEHTGDAHDSITISVGVACGSIADDHRFKALVEASDAALYRAKAAGRNRWSYTEQHAFTERDAA